MFAGSGKRHADFCRGMTLELGAELCGIDSAPLLHGQGEAILSSVRSGGHE